MIVPLTFLVLQQPPACYSCSRSLLRVRSNRSNESMSQRLRSGSLRRLCYAHYFVHTKRWKSW